MSRPPMSRRALFAFLALAACAAPPPEAPPAESAPDTAELVERADFAEHFDEAGAVGTFVAYDPAAGRILAHDTAHAARRVLPASTFKIPNSLIALETGVVADTSAVFAWDGQERSYAPWNRDHTLATAFQYSVVWAYQDIARRVGEEQMRGYLQRADYGNADIGGGIDRFWLDGALRISPLEQVAFLQRLHERTLPFRGEVMDAVEGIMLEERGEGYVVHAKTGWALGEPGVGWYVGYVVRAEGPVYFALCMDMDRMEQAPQRAAIARAILAELGALPASAP